MPCFWLIFVALSSTRQKNKMNFIKELRWRGLINRTSIGEEQLSPGLENELQERTICAYIGYDPTAPSLTIGNLVTVMLLKHLQLAGHKPIVLLGGATGKIGDPSEKDTERSLKTYAELASNRDHLREQFIKLLNAEGENAALILDNADFYKNMDVFTFLRDIGKSITVNYMMAKDSVKSRLNSSTGISFTEFSYQVIQAYDFQYLYQHHNCILQMGGSDQWGNITSGTHLIGKSGGKGYGLTCPLLLKRDGTKFGKSTSGNIWLDPQMTSPYKFYQFWLNVDDGDLPKLWRIFSLKTKAAIETLERENPQVQKRELARELTTRIHSEQDYEKVLKATQIVFNTKLKAPLIQKLSSDELDMLSREIPSKIVDKKDLIKGVGLLNFLVGAHESLNSKNGVRRAIQGAALVLNGIKITDDKMIINADNLLHGRYLFMQNGRKNKFILVAE